MHIEDRLTKAIHAYADLLGGAPQVQLEIRAMADHMGAFLVEELGLKQEWAVGTFVRGKLDDIDDDSTDPQDVVDALAMHNRLDAEETFADDIVNELGFRRSGMTRLYTDWEEDEQPVADVDEDLAFLVDDDGEPCPRPNDCNWREGSDGDENFYVCNACGKVEDKKDEPVVFQDQ